MCVDQYCECNMDNSVLSTHNHHGECSNLTSYMFLNSVETHIWIILTLESTQQEKTKKQTSFLSLQIFNLIIFTP